MEIKKFESILLSYDKKLKPRIEYFYNWYWETIQNFSSLKNDILFKIRFGLIDDLNEIIPKIKEAIKINIDDFLQFEPPETKYILLSIFINDWNFVENNPFDTMLNDLIKGQYERLQTYVTHKHPPKETKINDFDLQTLAGKKEFDLNDIATITQGFTEKQQCLIIHLLSNFGRFDLLQLHQNRTDRAKFISQAIGRNWDNVYKNFNDLDTKTEHREIFTYKNLIKIVAVFKKLQLTDIERYLNDKINKIKPNW